MAEAIGATPVRLATGDWVDVVFDPVLQEADGLVVPGVGAFRAVAEALRASRGGELIERALAA